MYGSEFGIRSGWCLGSENLMLIKGTWVVVEWTSGRVDDVQLKTPYDKSDLHK